jgi:flagellar biosynthetic protein FliQ
MTPADVAEVLKDAVATFFQVAGPVLAVTLGVGFAISLVQALTQLQEQTIAMVPKIFATFIALVVAMPLLGAALSGYMARIAARIAAGGP